MPLNDFDVFSPKYGPNFGLAKELRRGSRRKGGIRVRAIGNNKVGYELAHSNQPINDLQGQMEKEAPI